MPNLATCLYFGTFNPIHTGHLLIAQAALHQFSKTLGLQTITFIPAGNPPHRADETGMADARHRLKMVRLATANNPAFQVSALEMEREGKSYTAESLELLLAQGLVQEPVPMIIGADALAKLNTWHRPEDLIKLAHFLQAPRPECAMVESILIGGKTLPLNTTPIEMPMLSLSSTWVRSQIQRNSSAEPLRYAVPEAVRAYITDNRLYGS